MVVIHIGTQKTGTTTLQGYLFYNSAALLAQGVRYICAGREKKGHRASHNEFARALQGRAEIEIWNRLRAELTRATAASI